MDCILDVLDKAEEPLCVHEIIERVPAGAATPFCATRKSGYSGYFGYSGSGNDPITYSGYISQLVARREVFQVNLRHGKKYYYKTTKLRTLKVGQKMTTGHVLESPDEEFHLKLQLNGKLILINTNNGNVLARSKFSGAKDKYYLQLTESGQVVVRDSRCNVVWSAGKPHQDGNPYKFSVTNVPAANVFKCDGGPVVNVILCQ